MRSFCGGSRADLPVAARAEGEDSGRQGDGTEQTGRDAPAPEKVVRQAEPQRAESGDGIAHRLGHRREVGRADRIAGAQHHDGEGEAEQAADSETEPDAEREYECDRSIDQRQETRRRQDEKGDRDTALVPQLGACPMLMMEVTNPASTADRPRLCSTTGSQPKVM